MIAGVNAIVVRQLHTQLLYLLGFQVDAVEIAAAGAGVEVAVRPLGNAEGAELSDLAVVRHPVGVQVVAVEVAPQIAGKVKAVVSWIVFGSVNALKGHGNPPSSTFPER